MTSINMRPIERIDLFLDNIDWAKLKKRWNIGTLFLDKEEIRKKWKENPDLRFGQLLINENLVLNGLYIWIDEDLDILLDQDIDISNILDWKSYYDENDKLLETPVIKKISELSTSHIKNIYKHFEIHNKTIHPTFEKCFKQTLKRRNVQKEDSNLE